MAGFNVPLLRSLLTTLEENLATAKLNTDSDYYAGQHQALTLAVDTMKEAGITPLKAKDGVWK